MSDVQEDLHGYSNGVNLALRFLSQRLEGSMPGLAKILDSLQVHLGAALDDVAKVASGKLPVEDMTIFEHTQVARLLIPMDVVRQVDEDLKKAPSRSVPVIDESNLTNRELRELGDLQETLASWRRKNLALLEQVGACTLCNRAKTSAMFCEVHRLDYNIKQSPDFVQVHHCSVCGSAHHNKPTCPRRQGIEGMSEFQERDPEAAKAVYAKKQK